MKCTFLSDLHLEFGPLDIQPDKGDILVLAGDIDGGSRVDWINSIASNFNHVVYVLGNHEFYGGTMDGVYRKIRENLAANVHLLNDESTTIENVTFHGTTLWSDFLNGNPISYLQCDKALTDYRLIRAGDGTHRFTPQIAHDLHSVSKMFLQKNVKKGDVVVTHMAPSFLSIHEKHKYNTSINGAYASDLSDIILDTQPALWFHGHMHNSSDYTIDDTRILCNPRGYVRGKETNTQFDPNACAYVR
tara:strand:+ start:116 stop:853 length:738 start_codon:yes stop_codon:yes gene_type:complete